MCLHQFLLTLEIPQSNFLVNFSNQIKENTKVIYLESPNSWTYEMQDLEEISKIAKKNKLITISLCV